MDFTRLHDAMDALKTAALHAQAIADTSRRQIFEITERSCRKPGQFSSRDTGVTHDTQSEDKMRKGWGWYEEV